MKNTFKNMTIVASVMFTVWMITLLIVAYIFIGPNDGLNIAASLLIASILVAALQAFWFYGPFIKAMRYAFRMLGFAAMLLPILFACGWFGGWFPRQIEIIWSFLIVFVVLFALISIGYGIYFKRTAGSYEKALRNYREKQKQ